MFGSISIWIVLLAVSLLYLSNIDTAQAKVNVSIKREKTHKNKYTFTYELTNTFPHSVSVPYHWTPFLAPKNSGQSVRTNDKSYTINEAIDIEFMPSTLSSSSSSSSSPSVDSVPQNPLDYAAYKGIEAFMKPTALLPRASFFDLHPAESRQIDVNILDSYEFYKPGTFKVAPDEVTYDVFHPSDTGALLLQGATAGSEGAMLEEQSASNATSVSTKQHKKKYETPVAASGRALGPLFSVYYLSLDSMLVTQPLLLTLTAEEDSNVLTVPPTPTPATPTAPVCSLSSALATNSSVSVKSKTKKKKTTAGKQRPLSLLASTSTSSSTSTSTSTVKIKGKSTNNSTNLAEIKTNASSSTSAKGVGCSKTTTAIQPGGVDLSSPLNRNPRRSETYFTDCDEEMVQIITEALGGAIEFVDAAIEYLDHILHTEQKSSIDFEASWLHWFEQYSTLPPSRQEASAKEYPTTKLVERVRYNYYKVQRLLLDQSVLRFNCKCDPEIDETVYAYVFPTDVDREVNLCSEYFLEEAVRRPPEVVEKMFDFEMSAAGVTHRAAWNIDPMLMGKEHLVVDKEIADLITQTGVMTTSGIIVHELTHFRGSGGTEDVCNGAATALAYIAKCGEEGITTTGFTEEGVVIAPIASAWNYQFFAEEVFYMKQGLRQKTYPTYLTPKRLGLPKRSEQEKKTEQEAIKSAIASAFGLPQYNIQTVYARVHKVARPHYDVDEED